MPASQFPSSPLSPALSWRGQHSDELLRAVATSTDFGGGDRQVRGDALPGKEERVEVVKDADYLGTRPGVVDFPLGPGGVGRTTA
ncbi:MAG: hypothetical protein PVH41_09445 [Anaerolineae bacterium]|jgi:hypothetical protein